MTDIQKQIDGLNLSPTEVREAVESLMDRERKRSRNDVLQVVSLAESMVRVAKFEDDSILYTVLLLRKKLLDAAE